jgi:hypothetical protein
MSDREDNMPAPSGLYVVKKHRRHQVSSFDLAFRTGGLSAINQHSTQLASDPV